MPPPEKNNGENSHHFPLLGKRKFIPNQPEEEEITCFFNKPKYVENLLDMKDALAQLGIDIYGLLKYAADGIVTLSHPIKTASTTLWVVSSNAIYLRDPHTDPAYRKSLSVFERLNKTNEKCNNPDHTELVTLSRDDCKKLLKLKNYGQSVFESGWRFTESSQFEATYPSYNFTDDRVKFNETDPICLRFEAHKKDEKHFDIYQSEYTYSQETVQDIELDREKLLISNIEINYLISHIKKEPLANELKNLELATQEFLSKIEHGNKSAKLAYVVEAAKHFWLKFINEKEKNKSSCYAKPEEIIRFLTQTGTIPEKYSSYDRLPPTQAEEAARIIRPLGTESEPPNSLKSTQYVTKKLDAIVSASRQYWANAEPKPDVSKIQQMIIAKLMENGLFSQSSATLAELIIRPTSLPETRGAKKKKIN